MLVLSLLWYLFLLFYSSHWYSFYYVVSVDADVVVDVGVICFFIVMFTGVIGVVGVVVYVIVVVIIVYGVFVFIETNIIYVGCVPMPLLPLL